MEAWGGRVYIVNMFALLPLNAEGAKKRLLLLVHCFIV